MVLGGHNRAAHVTTAETRAELRAIYDAIPDVHCKGQCWQGCGPIWLTKLEAERLEAESGRRLRQVQMPDLLCPFLTTEGRCSGYDARPLICRLFGAVEKMRCPEGCSPKRWLTDEEAYSLMERIQKIGGPVVSTSPGDRVKLAALRIAAEKRKP